MKEKFKIAIVLIMIASLVSSFALFFIGYFVAGFFIGGLFIFIASIVGQYANHSSTMYVHNHNKRDL